MTPADALTWYDVLARGGFPLALFVAVVALLLDWGQAWHAAGVSALIGIQLLMMRRFLSAPRERAMRERSGG